MPHASSNSLLWSMRQFRLPYIGSDQALMNSLRQLFPKPRYRVVTCPDRDSAERFIKSEIQYGLFIFDHEMRDRAAFDLAQLIRSLPHRQHLSVIIVGTESDDSLADFTKAAGETRTWKRPICSLKFIKRSAATWPTRFAVLQARSLARPPARTQGVDQCRRAVAKRGGTRRPEYFLD